MTLHDLFTLLILLIGTSGTNQIQYMKYISEYIPKLQIHQHNWIKMASFLLVGNNVIWENTKIFILSTYTWKVIINTYDCQNIICIYTL